MDGRGPIALTLRLPRKPRDVTAAAPRRILAMSGGGYRGLFAAEVIRRIEALLRHGTERIVEHGDASEIHLADRFDLFAGTSVGGLIAAGLAMGRSAEALRASIETHGPRIFDDRFKIVGRPLPIRKPKGPLGGLLGAKFDRAALEDAIDDVLGPSGKDIRIAEVPRPLLLVATCLTTQAPFPMSNLEPEKPGADLPLRSALIATSAAPGYFPAFDLATRTLVDGGLVANAPELLTLSMLKRQRPTATDLPRIVSIGTAGTDPATVPAPVGSRGLLQWLAGDLVPLTLEAQERLAIRQAQDLLGTGYWRINASPSPGQAGILSLDRATPAATRTLLHLAEQAAEGLDLRRLKEWLADPTAIRTSAPPPSA